MAQSDAHLIEVVSEGVDKGVALEHLAGYLGMSTDDIIAFGDNYNDMTMIGYAGMGVAMGNGEPEIKKIANYVCKSNDEDGIAETLQKFVLK